MQMLNLLDIDFKSIILNIFKEVKKKNMDQTKINYQNSASSNREYQEIEIIF